MKFFEKLFGKKTQPTPSPKQVPPDGPAEDERIRVYDAYGRELFITKTEWRDSVLLGNLENAKDDPDTLYEMIVGALDDGFAQDTLKYAKHLQRIDPNQSRAATLLGVVYLELDRLDDAERTLRDYIQRHGEEGYVLTNLAKVLSKRGDSSKAETILWRALELDPNQENAVTWYRAIAHDRDGEDAGVRALRNIGQLSGSWRAQLWLARSALEHQQKEEALKLYAKAIEAAPRPIPADLLMQMSGDLGQNGHLIESLRLTQPHFDVSCHGLAVGNNLIKANLDLGRIDHAGAIVDQLYSLKRPDYQQTLSFWDTEIAQARVSSENELFPSPTSLTMLSVHGPIWLPVSSKATSLFAPKEEGAVVVCFFGASMSTQQTGNPQMQLSDTNGRITRALTLFLSEQFHLRTTAWGQVMQPWIAPGGFVLSGQPWDTDVAVDQAKSCEPQGDYIVLTHLVATSQPQTVDFRLLRCIDGSLLDGGSVPLDPANLEPCFTQIANSLLSTLCQHAQVEPVHQPAAYQVPDGTQFNDYLLRLEQALAVRAAAMGDTRPDFLSGEREIIAGNIHLCLAVPGNVTTRILLAETLRRMNDVHPQVVDEFRDKVQTLETEDPLPKPAHTVIRDVLAEVFAP